MRLLKKYNLSVMAIFRNESHVLMEWVEHYIKNGVEHFYLINNNSTDEYERILSRYIEGGVVDLYDCKADGFQIGAYTNLLPVLKEETNWIGVFDLDEFIYAPDGRSVAEIVETFSSFESVLIPWLSFGSSGHVQQPSSVVQAFTRRGKADVSRAFLKAISRPEAIEYFSQHNPTTKNQNKVLSNGVVSGDELFISINEDQVQEFLLINNHYRLQSLEYFRDIKTARPEVNEEVADKVKKLDFFYENDPKWNDLEDLNLAKLKNKENMGFEI